MAPALPIRLATLAAVLALLGVPTTAAARPTPFAERVHSSVQRVLDWMRGQHRDDGSIGNRQATGLSLLCLLQHRASAETHAPAVGYAGLSEEDQELARRAVRYLIGSQGALHSAQVPTTYPAGAALTGISVYAATGGPDDVEARVPVAEAIGNGVTAFMASQGEGDCNSGGWNYNRPTARGDISTTHFAAGALAAAATFVPDARDGLARLPGVLGAARTEEGGYRYQACGNHTPSHAMTGAGLWCSLLSGLPVEDPAVQSGLRWLLDQYQVDRQVNWWQNSYYYYLWAATKALLASSGGPPVPGALSAESLAGVRDPAADGFPEEPWSWYYDFAWQLTEEQQDNGAWPTRRGNGSNGQDATADASFSCLVLSRSLAGACLDLDGDGICGVHDNCPDVANADQGDADGDRVGDTCDLCPDDRDFGQEDGDGDGLGDACDDVFCIPFPEECNGADDDCDGEVDEMEGEQALCATGEVGACARGHVECQEGLPVCVQDVLASDEVCDLADNDCDGEVDEDVRNACGRCGPVPAEICNAGDDDCDGLVDEGDVCPAGSFCVHFATAGGLTGECSVRCRPGDCGDGEVCHEGVCVDPCDLLACPPGFVCNPEAGDCLDPCEWIICEEGQHCANGICGTCHEVGCPPDLVCDAAGECVPDPCAVRACDPDEGCVGGECVPSCAGVACPLFSSCVDGRCVDDPCAGRDCPEPGTACGPDGTCEPDVCLAWDGCPGTDEICVPALGCVLDPCRGARCADGERCDVVCPGGQCRARCVADWAPPAEGEGEGEEGEGEEGEGEAPADEGEGESPAEGEGEPAGCDDGVVRDCQCPPDDRPGLQECLDGGRRWTPCQCPEQVVGEGEGEGGGPGGTVDPSRPAEDGCACGVAAGADRTRALLGLLVSGRR